MKRETSLPYRHTTRPRRSSPGRAHVIGGLSMTLIIALLLAVCLPLETSLAKKPTTDPDPPPVLYQIDFFNLPNNGYGLLVFDINNFGCVVGSYAELQDAGENQYGFVYDHPGYPDRVIDLNDLDYDENAGIPDGWQITHVWGINDLGDIVANLKRKDESNNLWRACAINMNVTPHQLIELNPDNIGMRDWVAGINLLGDIVVSYEDADGWFEAYLYNLYVPGLYDETEIPVALDLGRITYLSINDNREIAGQWYPDGPDEDRIVFRCQIDDDGVALPKETFPEIDSNYLSVSEINNKGVVLGKSIYYPGKGQKTVTACFRIYEKPEFLVLLDKTALGFPESINDQDDFITNYLIYHDQHGYLHPDELIDLTDSDDAADWFGSDFSSIYALNNRTTDDGFGQIAGVISNDGVKRGFVLTPRPPTD
ncbi:hypothetical protein [Novipirellula artificiosorum]|uniref:Phytase-like domain-containing protein n=1 Tax=Novipirellula artificiosorum TaxID=2528016 RepID=A0A5C6DR30_9BACT|nr:hypothetical protein [Novipirellula artificiosorum]TWU39300.1 hypothetical protein Poly41_21240 [Novipirellula artificiosorum]